jgi:hypothetical protein
MEDGIIGFSAQHLVLAVLATFDYKLSVRYGMVMDMGMKPRTVHDSNITEVETNTPYLSSEILVFVVRNQQRNTIPMGGVGCSRPPLTPPVSGRT